MPQYSIYVCTDYFLVDAPSTRYAENRLLRYLQDEGEDVSKIFFLTHDVGQNANPYPTLVAEEQDSNYPSKKKEEDTWMYKESMHSILSEAAAFLQKQALVAYKEDRKDKYHVWRDYLESKRRSLDYFMVHIKPFLV